MIVGWHLSCDKASSRQTTREASMQGNDRNDISWMWMVGCLMVLFLMAMA
jgi:hypothetical protein